MAATPMTDRLAAPPTVPSPTQADEGAQLFWLHCQPCHGDQGQGLTDEWRTQFPKEDQNCWQSGCHGTQGKDPPENGFVLPTAVPAVIGATSLEKFANTQQLYTYMRAAMPYEAPGNLSDEEYLAITAFIARAHDVWDGTPLDETNMAQVQLRAPAERESGAGDATTVPSNDTDTRSRVGIATAAPLLGGAIMLLFLVVGGAWLWLRRGQ